MTLCLFDAIREIAARIELAPHVLLSLDFDGTLTPIVEDPASAYLAPHMERVLRSLGIKKSVTLAIVSGRDRADLQTHVGLPGVIYAGNHGLDISGPGFVFVEPTAAQHATALREMAANLSHRLRHIRGARVEDKGLTLSVHYRQVAIPEIKEVRRIVDAALASADHAVRLTMGDKVFEIRPRVCWNKGAAVAWIRKQLGEPDTLVICLGDDVTDEDAFTACPDGIMVKVGDSSATAAHYHLEGPAHVRRFLEWVNAHCR